MADKRRCLHCKRHDHHKARGLCWRCHLKPDVRELYEPVNHCGGRGVGLDGTSAPAPPVSFRPRTSAKLAAMAARAERGLALCSPGDGPPRPDLN